jgi:alpha-1,2-mannosyltransferase
MRFALRSETVVLVAAPVFALVAIGWWWLGRPLGVDSAVYRAGGIAVLRGEPLYAHLSALPGWAPELPFTYPPFAALLFTPFAAVPVQWCWGLVAVAAVPAPALALRPFAPGGVPLLAAFGLQPVWQTVGLGQLNLILMALVVVDVLCRRGTRSGGVLIGLAAAIKLIPLIFVARLLLTGRRADALRALGAVLLPADSVRYWTSALFNDHFAQMKGWVGNQSWAGFAARTAPDRPWLARERDWTAGQALIGNAYLLVAVVAGAVLVLSGRRGGASAGGGGERPAAQAGRRPPGPARQSRRGPP